MNPVKAENTPADSLRTASQLVDKNIIHSESVEHHRNVLQTPLSASNKEKESNGPSSISSSSTPSEGAAAATTTIINNCSVTVVNQATVGEDEGIDGAIDTSRREQKKEEEQLQTKSTIKHIVPIAHGEHGQQQDQKMSSDDESENDSDLLNTLSQLHGLVQSPRASLIQSPDDENSPSTDDLLPVSDGFQKRTIIFQHGIEKSTNNHQKKTGNSFSLTSSTSSIQFTDDELHGNDLDSSSRTSPTSALAANEHDIPLLHSQPALLTGPTSRINHEDRLQQFDHSLDNSSSDSSTDMSSAVVSIVDKLVSDSIQVALATVHQYSQHAEQLVQRVLTEAVYQVYNEDHSVEATFDPFDHLWTELFQTFDGNLFSNEIESDSDAWFTTTNMPTNPISLMSFDFTGTASYPAVHFQESQPASLLIDLSDSAVTGHDSTRYCLSASVKANSLDDSCTFPDSALSKVIDFGRCRFLFYLSVYSCLSSHRG